MIANLFSPMPKDSVIHPKRACGILIRKPRWGLSWQGWILTVFALSLAGILLLLTIHPFLAVTHRVDANVLVVEGWVREYAIRAGVREFRTNRYERVYTTGGPVEGTGSYTNDYNTSASVGADLLKKSGLSDESVQMVSSRVTEYDRTYSSAVALRNWLLEHNVHPRDINVVTQDVHARRTWLLFQEAFGSKVKVGVIAVQNPDYDAKHWWRSSSGFRDVVSEAIAYLYAKFTVRKDRTGMNTPRRAG
jgi:uncharacterized SAM-binding protein YcdF (DUF218 family)